MRYHLPTRMISLSFMLCLMLFAATTALSVALTPPIYWHTTDAILPSDIQTLAAVPDILYARSWGQGIYCSNDHGVTWLTATAGLTLAVNPVTL